MMQQQVVTSWSSTSSTNNCRNSYCRRMKSSSSSSSSSCARIQKLLPAVLAAGVLLPVLLLLLLQGSTIVVCFVSGFVMIPSSRTTTISTNQRARRRRRTSSSASSSSSSSSALFVSIGLGPKQEESTTKKDNDDDDDEFQDYEIPNHEEYRLSRRTKVDERCDLWFASLLGKGLDDDNKLIQENLNDMGILFDNDDDKTTTSSGGDGGATTTTTTTTRSIGQSVLDMFTTPVPLENEYELDVDDPDWTPYVNTKLPWTPLVPAFGCEIFGIPVPRTKAEAWRHFDVANMISTDYSGYVANKKDDLVFDTKEKVNEIQDLLIMKGGWLNDDECNARLIYINGRYVPQLSKTSDIAYNIKSLDHVHELSNGDEVYKYLSRLPDGFTDELATISMNGDEIQTNYSQLSKPHHNLGKPITQFAINTQQGTACFAALNTIHTTNIAYVQTKNVTVTTINDDDDEDSSSLTSTSSQPVVYIVNAVTPSGGGGSARLSKLVQEISNTDSKKKDMMLKGVAFHPRTLVIAEEGTSISFVQSCIDLNNKDDNNNDVEEDKDTKTTTTRSSDGEEVVFVDNKDDGESISSSRPKLYNGYTQIFVKGNANVTHSYIEETGGIVTPNVEASITRNKKKEDDNDDDNAPKDMKPMDIELERSSIDDTHVEHIDVHVMGEGGNYNAATMCIGGSGRVRVTQSISLLRPTTSTNVYGFCLSGGFQKTDIKTNIHHIADHCTSEQLQKNMISGRAVGSFRGRIRVEQSAQQTDSQQLSRTVLLSDRCRSWSIPSLEIIADDVKCAHGATVSDLSDEELFYLRSRGLDRDIARQLLMYAYATDISTNIEPQSIMIRPNEQQVQDLVEEEEKEMKNDDDDDDDNIASSTIKKASFGLERRVLRRLQNLIPKGERAVMGEYQSI